MDWEPTVEAGVIRPAILDDDLSFFELLLVRPDLVSEDVVFFADGRSWGGTTEGWPIAVGWRRAGGPVILGAATGTVTDALLLAVLHLAGASAAWSLGDWSDRVREWWEDAPPEVRDRVAGRWKLAGDEPPGVEAWTRAVWGEEPAPGRAAVGVVATRLPDSARSAVAWLAEREAAVAYAIRWYGADASPVPRLDLVEGSWSPVGASPVVAGSAEVETIAEPREAAKPEVGASPEPAAEPEPAAVDAAPAEPDATGSDVAGEEAEVSADPVVAGIEAIARETGASVSRSAGWVRIAGLRRSLRVFPSPDGVDIQLVGLDEGALVGLRYRHGVPLQLEGEPEAPPGVHLRLAGPELGPAVSQLLRSWLAAPRSGEGPGGGGRKPSGSRPPKPRGRGRRGPRNPRR